MRSGRLDWWGARGELEALEDRAGYVRRVDLREEPGAGAVVRALEHVDREDTVQELGPSADS